uniref:Solute carrier family 40 protein n=1 Tax=Rodentolepis nana TaxID=102285 RepID=A0A0R3TYR3_RODNA
LHYNYQFFPMSIESIRENKLDSISEISVFDNYRGNLCTKYEFCTKGSKFDRSEYPKRNNLFYMAKSAFLPEGYPNSVSGDYLEYQIWDSVQALSSSIIGALAGQAVLIGVGVGDSTASVLAATLTWLFKDGVGMVGRIVFAGWQGTSLDSQCKQWRIFADLLNDMAFFIEILSLHAPSFFTLIVCISSVMRAIFSYLLMKCFAFLIKALVGVVGGATRAAIAQHQALENNMADVAAKDGSQETLSNLLALFLNFILLSVVTGNSTKKRKRVELSESKWSRKISTQKDKLPR